MWSVRGAPHAHRANQLDVVRDALAPLESDEGGKPFVDAVSEVAHALNQVVTGPTPKGDASAALVGRVPASLIQWCARCKAEHIPDDVFRAAGRQAQLVIGPTDAGATVLYPRPRVRQITRAHPRRALLDSYFRANGPTTATLFRDWMAGGTRGIAALWEELGDDLVRVAVDGKRYDLPEPLLIAVQEAPAAKGVALLPPNDPYLRQVDRTQLIPDTTRRRAVYRALSAPGALLVAGEVVGTWRYRRSEHQVTAEPFEPLTAAHKSAVEKRAAALATSTGDETPTIAWS